MEWMRIIIIVIVEMVKQERKQSAEKVESHQPVAKKIKKDKVETVPGEREYRIKSLLDYEQYRTIKLKKYNLRRKQAKQAIHIDKFQVKAAVEALKKFEDDHQSPLLLEEPGFIYLEIVTSKVVEEHSIRPVQIPLPHPIYTEQFNSKFAVIVADPSTQYTEKIQDMNIPLIAEVIGYEKLKKEFAAKKDKKSLLYNFDLFFCDWRIYNILRKPTGSLFYQRKKIPFPIDCENVPEDLNLNGDYEAYLNTLGSSTYFILGNGPVYSLKVARISMGVRQQVKNIINAAINVLPHILGKLDMSFVRQISVKTSRSPSLPIFNQLTLAEIQSLKA